MAAKPTGRILRNVAQDEADELARLRAENEKLKAGQAEGISFKVGEKGGLSLYGLGRFPVTLYYEQWLTLLANEQRIRQELEARKSQLKRRD